MSYLNKKLLSAAAATVAISVAASVTPPAEAAVVTLDFEGLKNEEKILDFYNGGTGSLGSMGPNYGISFGDSARALIDSDNGGTGNFANEPSSNTIAFFLSDKSLVMDVAAGFDQSFSFYYSSLVAGGVIVYEGLGATGNILATLNLAVNYNNNNCGGDPTGLLCNWDLINVNFAGMAKSVKFVGGDNATGFDNITLGRNGETVPEPASVLGLLGIGFLGTRSLLKGRKKQQGEG